MTSVGLGEGDTVLSPVLSSNQIPVQSVAGCLRPIEQAYGTGTFTELAKTVLMGSHLQDTPFPSRILKTFGEKNGENAKERASPLC